MKKFIPILFCLPLLFGCSKPQTFVSTEEKVQNEQEQEEFEDFPLNNWVHDTRLSIVFVDEEFNDRFNPNSLSYFGEEYINGIKRFGCYGSKERVAGKGILISTPNSFTLGYYFMPCDGVTRYFIEDEKDVTYYWICYPDGDEEEIKIAYLKVDDEEGHTRTLLIEKIWINGELAYSMSEYTYLVWRYNGLPDYIEIDYSNTDYYKLFQDYYNPKFYPWMRPEYDNNGILMRFVPEGARNVTVLVK